DRGSGTGGGLCRGGARRCGRHRRARAAERDRFRARLRRRPRRGECDGAQRRSRHPAPQVEGGQNRARVVPRRQRLRHPRCRRCRALARGGPQTSARAPETEKERAGGGVRAAAARHGRTSTSPPDSGISPETQSTSLLSSGRLRKHFQKNLPSAISIRGSRSSMTRTGTFVNGDPGNSTLNPRSGGDVSYCNVSPTLANVVCEDGTAWMSFVSVSTILWSAMSLNLPFSSCPQFTEARIEAKVRQVRLAVELAEDVGRRGFGNLQRPIAPAQHLVHHHRAANDYLVVRLEFQRLFDLLRTAERIAEACLQVADI